MSEPQDRIVARTLLHSAYVQDVGNDSDAVIVSEIVETESGKVYPNLRTLKNPQFSYWVTEEQYRTHTDKKEFETLKALKEVTVPYKNKDIELFNTLNGYYPKFLSPKMRRELYQSPYVYGANITVQARVAMRYKNDLLKQGRTPHSPTTGFFDIERSLLPDTLGQLPLMVFTAENQVYLAMKKSFMNEEGPHGRVDVTIDDMRQAAKDVIDPLVESIFAENKDLKDSRHKMPFEYHFFAGDTEVDMIKWIFGKMHESKTSFIGIWNLGFDIPEIMKVLKENDIPLAEVFSDPQFRGTKYAYASYREDKRKVAHITQKWHWLTNTAHFQFIDSMSLFSYIRVVDGKQASYALDDILKNFGLGGKLKVAQNEELEGLQQADWHRAMLSRFFKAYALYAMWDGMSLQLMEWLNNDLTAMMLLGDTTPPNFFVNQTIRVTNTLFQDWMPDGMMGKVFGGHVLGTGVDVEGIRDSLISTAGGAVLKPQNLRANGMKLFVEWPSHSTRCFAWLGDLDFSAQYPSNILSLNISKQTKLGTLLSIDAPWIQKRQMIEERTDEEDNKVIVDISVEVFCSYLISQSSSGYDMGVEFFNLPSYSQADELFENHLKLLQIA